MSLRQRIEDELKAAMKARVSGGDALRLETCRLLKSAVKYREIELGKELDDGAVVQVAASLIKQRRDSAQQFRAGGKEEAAQKEEAEIGILQGFLPSQLGADELEKLVAETIAETQASGPKDMGNVMKALKAKVAGRADGKALSDLVKARLSGGA
ncbi:MAG: GatB/YqeY domain-containing protein [Deltaproteobacteria bacterium]